MMRVYQEAGVQPDMGGMNMGGAGGASEPKKDDHGVDDLD
jgi:hypothetical protein